MFKKLELWLLKFVELNSRAGAVEQLASKCPMCAIISGQCIICAAIPFLGYCIICAAIPFLGYLFLFVN